MSTHDPEPQYGQRLPPGQPSAHAPRSAHPASPRAVRRMVRGLSFTLVLLGLLLGAGLTAFGLPWGWAVGALLVLPGLAGFAGVQAQLHPGLRDPAAPPRRRSWWWLVPGSLLLLGLLPLAGTLAVESVLAGTPQAERAGEYVAVLVVAGMTLVVAAAMGFALVAVALFTVGDDDDSLLRPTDYAERPRRTGAPVDHYDSEWIRGPRRDGGDRRHPDGTPSDEGRS